MAAMGIGSWRRAWFILACCSVGWTPTEGSGQSQSGTSESPDLIQWEVAGRRAADSVTVSDFRFLGALPAASFGLTALAAFSSNEPGGPLLISAGSAGLVGVVWVLAATGRGSPPDLVGADGALISIPLSQSAFNDGFRSRLRERRKAAVVRGAGIGTLIGVGAGVLFGGVLSATMN